MQTACSSCCYFEVTAELSALISLVARVSGPRSAAGTAVDFAMQNPALTVDLFETLETGARVEAAGSLQ